MLQHVALELRREDLDAELRFWALVGFGEVEPPPAVAGRSRWAQRDGSQVHLMVADDPAIPPSGHAAVDLGPDYDGALARLREAGFAPEARREHWGAPRAFVSSPAGHRVELMAAAPGG